MAGSVYVCTLTSPCIMLCCRAAPPGRPATARSFHHSLDQSVSGSTAKQITTASRWPAAAAGGQQRARTALQELLSLDLLL